MNGPSAACAAGSLTSKLSRYADTSAGKAYNNIYGTLVSATQLKNELRPTFEILSSI